MTIISQQGTLEQREGLITRFFKQVKLGKQLKSSNITKASGVSTVSLYQYLFNLVFLHQNHYSSMQQEHKPFAGDTVYRFLHEGRYNWEKFLLRLALSATDIIRSWSNSSRNELAIVIDDTPFKRDRSKRVELLSRVYDHASHKFFRGYQMLTMAWTDGYSIIPCGFRLIASSKAKNLYVSARQDLDKRTLAAKRRIAAQKSKPELVMDMLKQIANSGIIAHYVLMDSWFFMPQLMLQINQLGFDAIVRMRRMKWTIYRYRGRLYTLDALYHIASKHTSSATCSILVEMNTASRLLPIRIAFGSDRSKNHSWFAVASTDVTLSSEDIIRIYGKRWGIETMFRICKENLRLSKEFETRSYDAAVASTTIVLTRYMCLGLEHRSCTDKRSWGELFRICLEELIGISFQDSLLLLLRDVAHAISCNFSLDSSVVQDTIFSVANSTYSLILSVFPPLLFHPIGCEC